MRDQLKRAEKIAHEYQDRYKDQMKIIYVVPDYFEDRPKKCMNGWGNIFLTIAPDGVALPCHSARQLPGLELPNVHDLSVKDIWNESNDFNKFRGMDWMKEPCRSCDEKEKDLGGCRCQAYMMTGDPANTDPICSKSANHQALLDDVARIESNAINHVEEKPLIFRNMKNSKEIVNQQS